MFHSLYWSKSFLCVIGLWFGFFPSLCKTRMDTNQGEVRVSGGSALPHRRAAKYGYTNLGQAGGLKDHCFLSHRGMPWRAFAPSRGRQGWLAAERAVGWIQQQITKRQVKREPRPFAHSHTLNPMPSPSSAHPANLSDPEWSRMWFAQLCRDEPPLCRSDMNIAAAWGRGYSGRGVVVAILDNAMERNHADLKENYDAKPSYDVIGHDRDEVPSYDSSKDNDGTRCGGVRVAFNAKILGMRMSDGDEVTSVEEAWSLRSQRVDVYVAGLAPDQDGRTVDGPAHLTRLALETSIRLGRKGRGSVFVWAVGGGGRRDHCSCDGHSSSIYTVSVSSTTPRGARPPFLEECPSILCSAYCSTARQHHGHVTSDLQQGCTDGCSGTSVSASIAAGIISLSLEANPRLTWRDVQHIIVRTSRPAHLSAPDWHTNAAGHRVSHLHGFGLMDAEAMVREAGGWRQVPPQHTCVENADRQGRSIPPHGVLRAGLTATGCRHLPLRRVAFLEHVVVTLSIAPPHHGHLSINLISPSGTKSRLLSNSLSCSRPFGRSADGFQRWEFMTTHCWGENPAGNWTLEVSDSPPRPWGQNTAGELKEWSLVLYGTSVFPYSSTHHQQPRSAQLPAGDELEYSGPCDPECDEFGCEGPGANQCIGCLHHFLKNRNNTRTCVSECHSGFYADSRGRCRRCYFLCAACVGGRRDQCTSCKAGFLSQEGSSVCVSGCSHGYYPDGSVCRKCSEDCVKCTSADICVECGPGSSLRGGECGRSCEAGSFYSSEHQQCEPCHSACTSCTGVGEGECTTCAEGFLLEDRRCVRTCSDGFYPVMHLGTCNRCESGCLTCGGPGEACSTCMTGLALESGACIPSSDCQEGEYQDESGACHLCDLTCQHCKGPETWDCIRCTPGRVLEEGRCDSGCSPGRYPSDGRCHLCDLTCAECSAGGPENCTSCGTGALGTERPLFRGRCVDSCPEHHFLSEGRSCEPCPEDCTACSGPDWCLSCNSSQPPTDGVCARMECGEGEVEDPEYGECMVCEEGCRKCVLYNPRHCLSCKEGFYRFQDSCYKTCPAKSYSVEEELACVRCPDTCVSCDEAECFWCEADFFLSDGQCVEQCEEGYYGDEESQECERCHGDCRTCSGPDADDCDSCEEPGWLEDGECVREQELCPRASFLNGDGECESCHPSCESCWGGARNQCSTCGRGRFLSAQQACVGRCPAGSFGGAGGRCEPCPPGCVLCGEEGVCLRCRPGRRDPLYLQEGRCVRQCVRSYAVGQVCVGCVPECVACAGNASWCLECVQPLLLLGHSCVEACPPLHLPLGGRCQPCPPACQRCSASDLCVECKDSHVLYEGRCVEECPAGFFRDVGEKVCMPCSGPDQGPCQPCANPGSVRYNGECRSECPSNTYHDQHSGECKDCEASCQTCEGPGSSQCSSCRAGLELDGGGRCFAIPACPALWYRDTEGRCRPCPSPCARCTGPRHLRCLSCRSGHFLLNGSCVEACPMGYLSNEQRWLCEACHPSCLSCTGSLTQHCLTCRPHLYRQDTECVHTCPPSYYGNVSTGACEPCDPSCGECSGGGAGQCLSCRDGQLYLRPHSQCRASCPPGFYPDPPQRTCESCHTSCRTCTGKGFLACDSCHHGYSLSGGMCESQCIMGQYPVPESAPLRCEGCDASCLACSGPRLNNCTLCPALALLTTGGRCLPCCGNETQPECCNCTETREQCVLRTNSALHNMDASTAGPALFITLFLLLLLGVGTVVFLALRGHPRRPAQESALGYEKLDSYRGPPSDMADSRHQGEQLVNLDDLDFDDDDDEEDIVYMSRDGTVYRKFRYGGHLGGQEEPGLEFNMRKYSFP